jgi:hypothetical protein
MEVMTDLAIHQEVEPVAFLLGTWRGEGAGIYPTIDDFAYGEEIQFRHVGKPFLIYTQRTWNLANDSELLHSEMGYWRPQPDGGLEVVLAHPFGSTELLEGRITGTEIELTSKGLLHASTGSAIHQTERRLWMEGDDLFYSFSMSVDEQPLQNHLKARLSRTS